MSLALVKHNNGMIKVHQPPLIEIALHVYLNKIKHPLLAEKLSSFLNKMKMNGLFETLVAESLTP